MKVTGIEKPLPTPAAGLPPDTYPGAPMLIPIFAISAISARSTVLMFRFVGFAGNDDRMHHATH